jgi:hypothetical protein
MNQRTKRIAPTDAFPGVNPSDVVRISAIAVVLLCAAALVAGARASDLIDRGATNVRLETARGTALLSYRARGAAHYVRAWVAINAIAPTQHRRQVTFQLRRSTTRPSFRGRCRRIHPLIPDLVTACMAPDGSFWAVQTWRRALPNYGRKPTRFQALPELRLSHWSGDTAVLTLKADWSYDGRFEHVYGSLSYRGVPVHGFRSTRVGRPLDSFGRNIYLDTYASGYGPGWRRENSFLAHNPTGFFCYVLIPHNGRPSRGVAYRAMVIGPGVTPDVGAFVSTPGPYNAQRDAAANAEQAKTGDRLCHPN